MSMQDIRPSPIAGRWYPGQRQPLADSIDRYLAQAEVVPVDGNIKGLLVPHAGHRFSGAVAAHAFKLVHGMVIDTVVLIGPFHALHPAPVITSGHDAYTTPLGNIPVDRELINTLNTQVSIDTVRRDQEHSLEIELPFLQRTVGTFKLVPLSLRDQSLALAQTLGRALAAALAEKRALLIASSDLSHFYPQPVANTLDGAMLGAVADFDPAAVIRVEEDEKGFACGRGAIATVMIAAQALGADTAQIVSYATSGDVTGDYQQVVGYGAAVFYQQA